ncbi:ABC transporter substrate-binding protein [Bradyrhizobium sp. 186]|uniref:ABC transporter substrate-binding protein n=1 Tax=Bradyrhizobium sp. 186 TaxID=2782654 RepID=UPI002000E178|nr:ABC transporter substrate-binding protein [Bradyrhizobium sp. 186]UPK38542.1 ABC transporter substrate-binding protein [Bradyrhizobium sp. 186]
MKRLVCTFMLLMWADASYADVKVGVVLSLTGPAASAGLLEQKALAMLPKTIGTEAVEYVVLDDATDTSTAIKSARKLIVENNIDVLVAATATPTSFAASTVADEAQVPQIALAPFGIGILKWSFITPPSFATFAKAVVADMSRRKIKKVAFLGYADALGQIWLEAVTAAAAGTDVKIELAERYNRTDTSILSQVLRVVGAQPDAVVVGATSASAAEPQKALVERGYKGPIYHTQAAATKEFVRAAGPSAETAILPVSLPIVAEALPDDHPSKARALEFVRTYEAANGEGSRNNFASHLWDAGLLLEAAVPVALKTAKPGTSEFRKSLRDTLESIRDLKVSNGVVNMTAEDHYGYDDRAAALARVEGGRFVLAK